MEMTALWKERKSKRSFPLFPHRLRKLANNRQLPTFPQLRRRLGFLYLQARLTSTLTKSVTYMPGTFCYRHARSHHERGENWASGPCLLFQGKVKTQICVRPLITVAGTRRLARSSRLITGDPANRPCWPPAYPAYGLAQNYCESAGRRPRGRSFARRPQSNPPRKLWKPAP